MEIKCKTLILLFFQRILILNGQLIQPPPILQWFIPVLNPSGYQTPTQNVPTSPFNLFNFLQLIRPAPGLSGTQTNTPPISNGIIPFLLQYHLQNFRPILGQQPQNSGNQQQIPNNFNIAGNSQNTNLIPSNMGNIGDLTPLQLQQLQQLLQLSALGNNPALLGLQPISPNQFLGFGPTSEETGNPIDGTFGLNPALLPINPNISTTNSLPTIKPTEINSLKPVTEFSNDFKPTESPFISLAPVKPIDPIDPTVISYVPYTTSIKPFIATTPESDDFEDFKPQVFPDPDQLSSFPIRTTQRPSRTTTFIPLFYERAESSNAQNSSKQKGLTEKLTSALTEDSTEQSDLSSKIGTSEMSPSITIVTDKMITSSDIISTTTKKNETKNDLEKVESLNLVPTDHPSQINLNDQPKENIADSPPMVKEDKIELIPDSDPIMNQNSQIEDETEPLEPQSEIKLNGTEFSINLIPIQNDEISTSFVQSDELPNEKITVSNQHKQNDSPDIPTILLNPPMHQNSNTNPIIIINRVPYQENVYPNIPHFAYLRSYSNSLHPVSQPYYWSPMPYNNLQRNFNFYR